jgi:hypothetical protein
VDNESAPTDIALKTRLRKTAPSEQSSASFPLPRPTPAAALSQADPTLRREISEWPRPKHEESQIPPGDVMAHLHDLVWVPSRQHVIEDCFVSTSQGVVGELIRGVRHSAVSVRNEIVPNLIRPIGIVNELAEAPLHPVQHQPAARPRSPWLGGHAQDDSSPTDRVFRPGATFCGTPMRWSDSMREHRVWTE